MTLKFNQLQLQSIKSADISIEQDELIQLFDFENVKNLSAEQLLLALKIANASYRAGFPLITDLQYDNVLLSQLKSVSPEHHYLNSVEPDPARSSKTVALPQKMLSTDKAYSFDEIKKWVKRLLKTAEEISYPIDELQIRVTPKLDGYAAYDDGTQLYTRGDGNRGQDITRAFKRGLQVADGGRRGLGAGEIVIKKSYFENHLAQKFENSRNIQAAIIAEKKIDQDIQQAIDDGACVFYPFETISNWSGSYLQLLQDFESICEQIWNAVDFDVDGIILETTAEPIKQTMGSTRHHHRWQIAFKVNEESAKVEVMSVTPQTSRTGRISPVAELKPIKLSGATISRVTVHHYNMVKTNGVGKGAIVEIVRSGLVIPKIERVIKAVEPDIPESCPSCGSHLIWESDHLICPNKTDCPAQTENTLVHFFKTLGNVDGFGPKVIERLHQSGIKQIHQIYLLQQADFSEMGFGDKTSQNLQDQLEASRTIEIEDWRFLAAFGVTRLGFGNCEKLLEHHDLLMLFDVSVESMVEIDGFALVSAEAIVEGLANIRNEFMAVYGHSFNLSKTEKISEKNDSDLALNGQQIVFTGSMQHGSRGDMEKEAKAMGAKVGKSVSSKTSILVTGDKVGANKINAAKEKGVTVLTEAEYRLLIKD